MTDGHQLLISLWGAAVSTILGGIKVWELTRDRPRLSTSYSFSTCPDTGNRITVHNTSKTPALATYWELVWADRRFGRTGSERIEADADHEDSGFVVPAHSSHTLHFREADHFWPHTRTEGRPAKLYLRLYLAGRRTAMFLPVWAPGQ